MILGTVVGYIAYPHLRPGATGGKSTEVSEIPLFDPKTFHGEENRLHLFEGQMVGIRRKIINKRKGLCDENAESLLSEYIEIRSALKCQTMKNKIFDHYRDVEACKAWEDADEAALQEREAKLSTAQKNLQEFDTALLAHHLAYNSLGTLPVSNGSLVRHSIAKS